MTSSQIFDIIAPQYASASDKASFLTLAGGLTSSCFYGSNYEMAVALRAAHMKTLTATRTTGDGGNITSKSEGELSLSYGFGGAGRGDDLNLTHYGQQLLGLRHGSGAFIGVTGGNDDGCWDS